MIYYAYRTSIRSAKMQVDKLFKEASELVRTKAMRKPAPTGVNSFKKKKKDH